MGLSEGDYRAGETRSRPSLALLLETLPRTQCLKVITDRDGNSTPGRFGADLSDDFRRLGGLPVRDRSELLSFHKVKVSAASLRVKVKRAVLGERPR